MQMKHSKFSTVANKATKMLNEKSYLLGIFLASSYIGAQADNNILLLCQSITKRENMYVAAEGGNILNVKMDKSGRLDPYSWSQASNEPKEPGYFFTVTIKETIEKNKPISKRLFSLHTRGFEMSHDEFRSSSKLGQIAYSTLIKALQMPPNEDGGEIWTLTYLPTKSKEQELPPEGKLFCKNKNIDPKEEEQIKAYYEKTVSPVVVINTSQGE
jgi:hypothetical protein